MKKIKSCIVSLSLLFVFTLAGCENANGNREAELEEKITQLEQQIATLEAEKTANVSVGVPDVTESTNQSEEVSQTASVSADERENVTKDASPDTIDSLTKEVSKVAKKVDAAQPSKEKEKKQTEFFQLKEELDVVEERLDAYEDSIESQYRQGSISYEEYKSEEKQLDALEDKLEKWEDKLESSFGLDD